MEILQNEFLFTTETPFEFARHATIGVGGCAEVAYCPRSEEGMQNLVNTLKQHEIPFLTLGNMSNVLPPDGNLNKAIVRTNGLRDMYLQQDGLYASAGVTSGAFLRACKAMGLGGMEFLTGIPCTIGGALYMNAGANGEYVSTYVKNVKVLYRGRVEILPVFACEYAYKSSVFMREDMLILGATFHLQNVLASDIENRLRFYANKRAHLPTGKSMGCVFKNPQGESAGRRIDGAGLKGLRIGGARISPQHANFIINENGATSADIKSLITVMKNAVFAQYNIRLEEEIRYII